MNHFVMADHFSFCIYYGPEFIGNRLRNWLAHVGVKTPYIEPGRPWENGYCESFNGTLRNELLDGELFYGVKEAQALVDQWVPALQHDTAAQLLGL